MGLFDWLNTSKSQVAERQGLLPAPPPDFARPPADPTVSTVIRFLPARLIGYACGLYSIANGLHTLRTSANHKNALTTLTTNRYAHPGLGPVTYGEGVQNLPALSNPNLAFDTIFAVANLLVGTSCLMGTAKSDPTWIDRAIKLCYTACACEAFGRPAVDVAVADTAFTNGVVNGGASSFFQLCAKPLPLATMAYLLDLVKQHIYNKLQRAHAAQNEQVPSYQQMSPHPPPFSPGPPYLEDPPYSSKPHYQLVPQHDDHLLGSSVAQMGQRFNYDPRS